jgi:apolipoprotein N-acyltransferase
MVSFFLALTAGITLAGAYAPLNWWFLLPISIAIFLYAVTNTRFPFLTAFIFGSVFNFLTLQWSGTYVGLAPVLFLVALQTFFYLPLGYISYKRNRNSRMWLILPILLIADEMRSIIPFGGFGWNRLSFSQSNAPYLQAASYLGDSVLAFIAISLGIALYLLFARTQFGTIAIVFAITTMFIVLPSSSFSQGSASILGIQGNVPKLGLDFNSRAQEVFNLHLKQTNLVLNKIKNKVDVIVWPENSIDVDPFKNPQIGKAVGRLAKKYSTPIIAGAVLQTDEGPENVSVLWNEQGSVSSTYVKRTLTPFGEYIPLRSLATKISPYVDDVKDFVPGKVITNHQIGSINIAPIICYEIIDDSNVEERANLSNLLIVQTNNATFASSAQSFQQLNISRIRAVENNRWLVSTSTTGVSAVVDNHGKIIDITQQNVPDYVLSDVDLISRNSLANSLGSWSALICIALSIVIYLRKRSKNE